MMEGLARFARGLRNMKALKHLRDDSGKFAAFTLMSKKILRGPLEIEAMVSS